MAKATKEAIERAKLAGDGFKLLSLLTVGGVEKNDWRNLDKTETVWDDIDTTVNDLKETLYLLKNDFFFDAAFSWFNSLKTALPEYGVRYFLAKCVQHYKSCDRPKFNGKGYANKRNKFIKKARLEFDRLIYDSLVKYWGGGQADDKLKSGLADPSSSRNLKNGSEVFVNMLKDSLDYDDPKLVSLPYANVEGSHDDKKGWNVGQYDKRAKALFLYHLTLIGCSLNDLKGEKSVDVEHIIAQQSWYDEYENADNAKRINENRCHHFCNLTLLGSSINRSKNDTLPGNLNTSNSDDKKILNQLEIVSGLSKKELASIKNVHDFKSKLWRQRRNFILFSFTDNHRFKILNSKYKCAGTSSNTEIDGNCEVAKLIPSKVTKMLEKDANGKFPWFLKS